MFYLIESNKLKIYSKFLSFRILKSYIKKNDFSDFLKYANI